jgi:hypothetical protein
MKEKIISMINKTNFYYFNSTSTGAAETGSGKTLAFGLPVIDFLLRNWTEYSNRLSPVALIIAPTRELALQITTGEHRNSDLKLLYKNITSKKVHVLTYVFVYVYIDLYTWILIYLYIHIFIYLSIHKNIYIIIYIYKYIYIYITICLYLISVLFLFSFEGSKRAF